jgi:SAM-dependent methyltransferase
MLQSPGRDGSMQTGGVTFGDGVGRWIDGLGRWRDVVRQRLVAEQLGAVLARRGPGPHRVLDVGCGQGTQALALARAGHTVTGLDSSAALLERFAAELAGEPDDVRARVRLVLGAGEDATSLTSGPFDLVCCHGVLMYLPDPQPLLTVLSEVAADDGVLSLLVRNGLAPAMRDGLRGRWSAALASFDRPDYVNRLGLAARAHTPVELDRILASHGWRGHEWFGVRVFTDHRDDDAPGDDDAELVVAVEREAARRDPYRRVAALHHLVYTRPARRAADPAPRRGVPVGARAVYDAVAAEYERRLGGELDGKPLDRALLVAFVELVGTGTLADVGCGPGHVTRFLAARHPDVVGIDLSPGMIAVARECGPDQRFLVGSLLAVPVGDGALSGVLALYSIIHLDAAGRTRAARELARVVRAGGRLLVAFHVDSPEFAVGEVNHLTEWFGHPVQLDGYFLDPDDVLAEMQAAGFALVARLDRAPIADVEYPSRRCYLLMQRRETAAPQNCRR